MYDRDITVLPRFCDDFILDMQFPRRFNTPRDYDLHEGIDASAKFI